ncbi:MAG: phage holin family protein [Candidatus Dormibacteraeota bacterium]|nr:phage holin family protein [Candidatus Dormibacteraeota bacterium]
MDSAPKADARTTTNTNGRRGVIDLARVAVDDLIRLVQQEIQLAKVEVKEMLSTNIKAAIMLAIAGVCALIALIMLLVTIALLVGQWWVALIEAGILVILALILGLRGKSMLKLGAPEKTMESLKEDAEWARHRLTRNGK